MNKTKIFFDIEKEIEWLNHMSNTGYRLTNKRLFTYSFKDCEKNSYLYQVEKRNAFSSKDNAQHINALSTLNINIITSQWGWFYFEKENDGKDFKIYSDIPSRIDYYRNLIITFLMLVFLSFSIIHKCLTSPVGAKGPYLLNISIPIAGNALIITIAIVTIAKYTMRISKLRRDNSLL
ncbi:MAG: DUF2812 domain-containing protein [Peptostreptococcaceae bacterium]